MPRYHWLGRARNYGLCLALAAAACHGDDSMQMQEPPFEPVSPAAYTAKVKNLLTGLAPTDAELMAVTADPAALAGLIDQWMATPAFDAKMLQFFQQSFQQTQLTIASFSDQLSGDTLRFDSNNNSLLFVKSARESFARTVLQLIKEGRPFTEVLTTNRYMLNPPLMAYMAYHDSLSINDKGAVSSRLTTKIPQVTFLSGMTIPVSQSSDPTSANFMKWTVPSAITGAGCTDPYMPAGLTGIRNLFDFMFGRMRNCNPTGLTAQFSAADYDAWKMVTIRPPKSGEATTSFYDVGALRTATEMVLIEPKVGFMTTPAFFANWATNASNQQRVTINQTLIVALGKSFDDTINNNIASIDELADDAAHANPATVCYACHKTLDPMKQFFRQSYTFPYATQADPAVISVPATFAFDGVVMSGAGQGVNELGPFLAAHPRFQIGWANKLCYYANSAACEETDPEFVRVAKAFKDSGFNWKTLVHELFNSPLVTLAARTQTFTNSEQPISISRRENFCVALTNRLGLTDICAFDAITLSTFQKNVSKLSLSVDAASYSRGAEAPVVSRDPNLFFRSSVENICRLVADQVVDLGATPKYSSTNYAVAIDDFVANVMALPPSDARATMAKQILTEHYNAALMQSGIKAVDALKSTFVLACTSPTSVSLGL